MMRPNHPNFRNILFLLLGAFLLFVLERFPSRGRFVLLKTDTAAAASVEKCANGTTRAPATDPPRAILFVHFHKSGGTTICNLVFRGEQINMTTMNGRETRPRNLNCNTAISSPLPEPSKYHDLQTCRMMETYTMDGEGVPFRRNNFLAVEVPFLEPLPCSGFRSFAIMRDPVERMLSNMQFTGHSRGRVMKWIENKSFSQREDFYLFGYPLVNSFVIRFLLGRERYMDNRPVDEEDLERAKARVDEFDAFVPLEYLDHENVKTLMKSTVEEVYNSRMKNKYLKANSRQKPQLGYFRHEQFLEILRRENKYDTLLYQYMLDKLKITR